MLAIIRAGLLGVFLLGLLALLLQSPGDAQGQFGCDSQCHETKGARNCSNERCMFWTLPDCTYCRVGSSWCKTNLIGGKCVSVSPSVDNDRDYYEDCNFLCGCTPGILEVEAAIVPTTGYLGVIPATQSKCQEASRAG